MRPGPAAIGALAVVLLAGAVAASLLAGPLPVSPGDLARAAFGEGPASAELAWSLRAPRVLTAVLTGGALAGAGAALQILFRNPLVAPDLLGVSSGAGLGAAAILLAGGGPLLMQAGGFLGGLASAALALLCAASARRVEPRLGLVLCGIVVGALASAGLALALIVADPYSQLPALTFWLLGSFGRAQLGEAAVAAALAGAGLAALLALGFRLDALSLGDEQARSLGLPARRLRGIALMAATLATSAATAVSGVVGWIGLLAPHAVRPLVGETASRLIPASIAAGAVLALVIDRLSTAFGPAEIPVGVLAAAVGAPAFLAVFIASARRVP